MTPLPEAVRSRLEPLERTLETLETPSVLIDAGIADANLARWQERCDRAGLANRPHIKTHRTAAWALRPSWRPSTTPQAMASTFFSAPPASAPIMSSAR